MWDIFAPWRIFPVVWFGALSLSSLHLSFFDASWSLNSWFTFIAAPCLFLLGCYLALSRTSKQLVVPWTADTLPIKDGWTYKPALILILCLFIISSGILIYEYIHLGVIPALSNPNVTRWQVASNSYIHRFALTLVQVVGLTGLLLGWKKKNWPRWSTYMLGIIFLISTILVFSLASRLFLISALIIPFVSFNYLHQRYSKKIAIGGLGLIFLATGVLSLVRFLQSGSKQFLVYMHSLGFNGGAAYFAPIYQNVAYNFKVYDLLTNVIPSTHPYFYGQMSIYAFRVFWGDKLRITSFIGGTPIAQSGFVASTYLGSLYADLGVLGVFAGSLILGFFCTIIYLKLLYKPSLPLVFIYALVAWNLMFAIYENLFILFDFWWAIAVVLILNILIKKYELWKS